MILETSLKSAVWTEPRSRRDGATLVSHAVYVWDKEVASPICGQFVFTRQGLLAAGWFLETVFSFLCQNGSVYPDAKAEI